MLGGGAKERSPVPAPSQFLAGIGQGPKSDLACIIVTPPIQPEQQPVTEHGISRRYPISSEGILRVAAMGLAPGPENAPRVGAR